MYWEQRPDVRLGRFVEAYGFSDDAGVAPGRSIRVVPDGCTDLLFSVAAGSGHFTAEIFGTKTRALLVPPSAPRENLAVRLRPGAAARFLRVPAGDLADTAAPLAECWGDSGRQLAAEVAAARDPRARCALVERVLLGWLSEVLDRDPLDDAVEAAVARIEATRGQVRIGALATELGLGERRLERAFRERVGVSPKRLARIARFRAAHAALARGAAQPDVALGCGYFDQAHMLRDFRAFAGAPPSAVFGAVSDSSNPPA